MPTSSVLHILHTIKDRGPVSRTDLQHLTGLSWGTITNTTRELLSRKFIREQGALSTKAGRKPMQLALNPASHSLLGLEISATGIHAILTNVAGDILWQQSAALPADSPDAILAATADLAIRAINAGRAPMGVGLVLPAPIDTSGGSVRSDDRFPGWRDVPIRAQLEARLQMPVLLERHANALALAHRWFAPNGATSDHPGSIPLASHHDDFICIHLGDTLDLGIIIGGDIFRGHSGLAGQFAHVCLQPDGPLCTCGNRGCVDAYCSTAALLAAGYPQTSNGTPHTIHDLAARAAAGDPAAREAFTRLGTHLARGIANLIHLFDPAAIVLAGANAHAAPHFMPALQTTLHPHHIPLQISPLDGHAPALGVCALLLQNAFNHQNAAPVAQALPA